jgi:hypothetical protein
MISKKETNKVLEPEDNDNRKTEIKLSKGYISIFLQCRRQEIMFIDKESTAAIDKHS